MDKKFTFYENILSDSLVDELHDYYYGKIIDMSRDKYGDLFVDAYLNGEARTVLPSTIHLTSDQQIRIVEELYNNESLPFYKNKKLLRSLSTPMKINNFLDRGGLPPHTDMAWGSMTLYLNKEWKEEWGGKFVWWTDDDTEQENGFAITPKYNCGIIDCYPEPTAGCLHRVEPVTQDRMSIQAFFGLPDHPLGEDSPYKTGNIPKKYMHELPESVRNNIKSS